MKFGSIILFTALVMVLISCDPGSTIKYTVVNATNDSIEANYQFVSNYSGDTSTQRVTIPPKSSRVINEEHALGSVNHYDERHDSMLLSWLTFRQANNVTSQNFKDKRYWKLIKSDNLNATYTLQVNSKLFKKK